MAIWRKTSDKKNKQTLSDIMRGMQYSVNTAQEILEKHHVKILNKYFNEEGVPITKRIKINDDKIIEVPLISIINLSSLNIDELVIRFKAKINSIELKNLKDDNEDIDRSCFEMDFAPGEEDDNDVSVKIKFKIKEQPEGISRIVDEFDKQINSINNK
ncbi:MAG TPA: DUF2589 domain-containing protein [Salinivirgaceae bacterium]|nr:DUF2589 domain-containing protein [Salinivirgaceae bacterium]HQA75495.1 DUF2589 domain-containing protein [Salinivirgaceae bacterium]